MKKIFLLLYLVLTVSFTKAQQGIHIGLMGGPAWTSILNKNDFDEGPKLDFKSTIRGAIGIQLQYNFADGLGIGTQLLYSGGGSKYIGSLTDSSYYDMDVKLNYLKIPVLLHFNSSPDHKAMFSAYLGPQFGLLVGSNTMIKLTYTGGGKATYESDKDGFTYVNPTGTITGTFDKNPYKSMDMGIVLGLGTNISISDALQLGIHFRADYGFGDNEEKTANHLFTGGGSDSVWENGARVVGVSTDAKREASHNVSAGFMLGLKYIIGT